MVGKRRRVCLKMGMGSGGIKSPESARALVRCGVYQTFGLGRGRCTLRRDGLLIVMGSATLPQHSLAW